MSKNDKKKNIEYDIELERIEAKNPNLKEYDFIFPLSNITSLDEQKIKVEELSNITKSEKKEEKNSKKY